MDTYKPISTIGYNTEEFLLNRLNELQACYTDLFWAYIYHDDELNKKPHYHLYIEPNIRLRNDDICMIRKSFEEFTEESELPLACMPFRKSNIKDWYLYSIHDSVYLNYKHLQKSTYDYDYALVKTSHQDILDDYVSAIDVTEYLSPIDKIIMCFNQNMEMHDAMSYLRIPYSAMYGFKNIWQTYLQQKQGLLAVQELSFDDYISQIPMPTDNDEPWQEPFDLVYE